MPWHLLDHTGSFWTKNEWPPSSPDCNPMNYAIWSILESRDCAKPHSSVNMLKASMKKTWSEIMPEVIVRSIVRLCAQFPDRLEKLFLNNSGQFACMFGSNKIFNFLKKIRFCKLWKSQSSSKKWHTRLREKKVVKAKVNCTCLLVLHAKFETDLVKG
jgi:hypothetical protein